MAGFSQLVMKTVFFLVLFISLVGILGHHRPLETLLFAISLAVGLTPEGLPMVTTVTLAVGAQRMAKQKVIVKYLESIENFGSIDTFCSDKTGTLTSGETQLEGHLDLSNQASDRVLLFGNLNSSYDTGIKSPLDEAILQYGKVDSSEYSKVGEIPFDFERRRLSVIVQHGDELLLITKGAPESVLPFCSAYEINNASKPLDDAARANFVKMYQDLNTQGYRALAVAYRSVPQEAHYSVTDEQNMVLLGFLTFADPPKPDAAQVLQALKSDGVQVKILTGDNELVTRHVCQEVGLESSRIVLVLDLLPHVACLPRRTGALPHRLVRGVARHTDAGRVYHSYRGQSTAQSPQSAAHDLRATGGGHRHPASVLAACRAARLHIAARAVLPLLDCNYLGHLTARAR